MRRTCEYWKRLRDNLYKVLRNEYRVPPSHPNRGPVKSWENCMTNYPRPDRRSDVPTGAPGEGIPIAGSPGDLQPGGYPSQFDSKTVKTALLSIMVAAGAIGWKFFTDDVNQEKVANGILAVAALAGPGLCWVFRVLSKKRIGMILLPFTLALVFISVACSAQTGKPLHPVKQTTLATDGYTTTLKIITTAAKAGVPTIFFGNPELRRETLRKIEPFRVAAAAALDDMVANRNKSLSEFDRYSSAFLQAMNHLLNYRGEIEKDPAVRALSLPSTTVVPTPEVIPEPQVE